MEPVTFVENEILELMRSGELYEGSSGDFLSRSNWLNINTHNAFSGDAFRSVNEIICFWQKTNYNVNGIKLGDNDFGNSTLKKIIKGLENITGLYIKEKNDYLYYGVNKYGEPVVSGGSRTARDLFLKMSSDRTDDIIHIEYAPSKEEFQSIGIHVSSDFECYSYGDVNTVHLSGSQIEAIIKGTKSPLTPETLGWGMVTLHEFLHTDPFGGLEHNGGGLQDPVLSIMNTIRSEMNDLWDSKNGKYLIWGQRYSHSTVTIYSNSYIAFSRSSVLLLKSGRSPHSFVIKF